MPSIKGVTARGRSHMNQFSILTTLVVSTTLILSLLGSTEAFSISTLKNPALVASRRPTVTTEKTLRHPSNLFETDNGLDEPSSDNTELIDKLSVEQRQELLQQAEAPLSKEAVSRRNLFINGLSIVLAGATGISAFSLFQQTVYTPKGFTRFAGTQFIAATGDPAATQGVIGSAKNEQWGVWTRDPGPRGVYLRDYSRLLEKDKVAPVGWAFDPNDWWLEEHGIIMEAPRFPMPPGRYLVTGGRSVVTGLTIDDDQHWKLDAGHNLYEVTHLPCRSARYRPVSGGSPTTAHQSDFPVNPGAEMPAVPGCEKQDYAVLFLLGKAA